MIETLAERTTRVIRDARISPRILSKLTPLHYTTVYNVMNGEIPSRQVTIKVLDETLDSLERLLKERKLPIEPKVSHKEVAEKIQAFLSAQ
jgi:hypothetical protein